MTTSTGLSRRSLLTLPLSGVALAAAEGKPRCKHSNEVAAPTDSATSIGAHSNGTRIDCELNGVVVHDSVDPRTSLLDWLRDERHLTAAKRGCDRGQCGACTVVLDGRRVVSCLVPAASLRGQAITTVEGLGADPLGEALLQAFVAHDGLQCGICTPGQIASAYCAIRELEAQEPSFVTPRGDMLASLDQELAERLSGNLCRCGAYLGIRDAVAHVARSRGIEG